MKFIRIVGLFVVFMHFFGLFLPVEMGVNIMSSSKANSDQQRSPAQPLDDKIIIPIMKQISKTLFSPSLFIVMTLNV